MKTKIAIVSGIIFVAILFTVITSSFMFPGLTCPAGTIVKNDVCVIASTDYGKSTQEHYEIEIIGMKDVYIVGEQYDFSYIISGYGYSCGSKEVTFPDQNGDTMKIISSSSCFAGVPMKDFVLDAQKEYDTTSVHGIIKKSGTYNVTISFDRPSQYFPTTASQKFRVVEN